MSRRPRHREGTNPPSTGRAASVTKISLSVMALIVGLGCYQLRKVSDDKGNITTAEDKLKDEASDEDTLSGKLPLYFRTVDANSDGFISYDEYKSVFNVVGIGADQMKDSFDEMDENSDGLLTMNEFVKAGSTVLGDDD